MNRTAELAAAGEIRSSYFWLFAAVTGLHCAWVLSLPLFPTQDGPVHLYLASIFRELLGHTPGIYAKYYLVRHYLPPYSFQYYLLVGLMQFISPLLADKLFVCLILISFAFGFRFLATGIGENGVVFSLFSLCLLLNWSLSMGFENYLLSLSMAFWALGLWIRFRFRTAIGPRIGFVLLLCLMALTHPVPVAIVLGFCGLDLGLTQIVRRRYSSEHGRDFFWLDVFTLIAGSSVLLYISSFTEKRRTADNIRNTIHPLAELRSFYGHLEGVRFFHGADWPARLYSGSVYLLLVIAAAVALTRSRKGSLSWRVVFVFFLLLMPLVPMDFNGSHMFATRLVILVWLAAFAAASGAHRLGRFPEICCVALALATSLGILWLAHRDVSREARQIAELTTVPASQRGRLGLLLPGLEQHIVPANDYGVDTYVWGGAHAFREGHDILLNTPWTDIPILPVNATPELGLGGFDTKTIEFFYELRAHIESGDPQSLALLSRADFVLFTTGGQPVDEVAVERILQANPGAQWSCAVTTSWTELCERKRSE